MQFSLDELRGVCSCGEEHPLYVKEIVLKSGALESITTTAAKCGIYSAVAVYDENTYEAVQKCSTNKNLLTYRKVVLDPEGLHADEHGVEALETAIEGLSFDGLIAVGSGTIHDIVRYVCGRRKIPFISVPTAASVDGFVSTVAAMTLGGYKISFPSASPVAVVADTLLFSKAPQRLTASGAADLLGKYTALADWKISHAVKGERICQRVIDMEYDALESIKNDARPLSEGDPEACERLMYGLLLSGLCMQMTGSSRPASGAEHHMSHMWEMGVLCPPSSAYHGEKVGVGLLTVAKLYHKLSEIEDISGYIVKYKGIDREETEKVYKNLTDSVMDQNRYDCTKDICKERLILSWNEIREIVSGIPPVSELKEYLDTLGGCTSFDDIGIPSEVSGDTLRWAPLIRNRLTLMRLCRLLDLPEEYYQ